jgi:hypothetical protein
VKLEQLNIFFAEMRGVLSQFGADGSAKVPAGGLHPFNRAQFSFGGIFVVGHKSRRSFDWKDQVQATSMEQSPRWLDEPPKVTI